MLVNIKYLYHNVLYKNREVRKYRVCVLCLCGMYLLAIDRHDGITLP